MNELNEWKGSEKKPWWNDADKIGGMAATVSIILLLIVLCGFTLKFLQWLLAS